MKKFVAALLVGTMLSGCVSAPTTTPQQTALKPAALGLSSMPAPAIADDWWKAFGDVQLDSLVVEALKNSPTLASAMARVRAAQSQLAASTAATYPQATLDGSESRERFSKDYIIPPPYGGSTTWVGTVQANLTWSLDLFGKEQAQIDRAKASAEAATLDATAARLMLSGAVTRAYIALARAYVLVDVAQDAVKERESVLSLTGGRVRAGLDTTASQKQAEALAAMAREELIRAKAVRELAVHQIAALIGHGADAYDIARPSLDEAALPVPSMLPADLLARRADIAAAQARITAAFQGREIARKAFYPDINLVAFAGWAALGLAPMFSGSALQYGAGPAIHLPLFDAGKIRANYAGATAGLDEAVADYNAAVVGAVKDAADAITQMKSIDAQATEQRTALDAAQASFDLAQKRYRSGLSPLQNVLDNESVLLDARRQYASLSSDRAAAAVALLMAVGGGFDAAKYSSAPSESTSHE
ncbi:MAG: efflux transporter outer membrane subunit [Proteobacteria bacterium]|nr:efflux transporter outer membrane subunit [Pseudomonadota bacterium]